MAIGDILTSPQTGWIRFDDNDSNLTYTNRNFGTGTTSAYDVYYNRTFSVVPSNQTVTFNFTGTKLRIIGTYYNEFSTNVKISIDGITSQFSAYNSTIKRQALLYEIDNLEDKEHFVEITPTGGKDFELDALDIETGRTLKTFKAPLNKILLLSNGVYNSIRLGSGTNTVPKMTSATTSGVTVTESSSYSANYTGWRAFNRDNTNTGTNFWSTANATTSGWLKIDYGTPLYSINKYTITSESTDLPYSQNRSPKNWTFEGSDTGVFGGEQVILDTQSNITSWGKEVKKEFTFNNQQKFRYYRINITANNGATDLLSIGEMELIYLTSNGIIQLHSHSEQNFINYGNDSPVKFDDVFSSKNYILQDTVSENAEGLWTTQLNRKPLSIEFN